MNFTLGLYKPKGAPKYIRAGHFLLLELATSCAIPSKTRSSTLSPCMLTVAVKTVVCSSCTRGWTCGGYFGSAFGWHPIVNFCTTLNQQMAIMVGNPRANFHTILVLRVCSPLALCTCVFHCSASPFHGRWTCVLLSCVYTHFTVRTCFCPMLCSWQSCETTDFYKAKQIAISKRWSRHDNVGRLNVKVSTIIHP